MKKGYYFLAALLGSGLLIKEISAERYSWVEIGYGFFLLAGVTIMAGIDVQTYEIPGFIQLYFLILGILRLLISRQLWSAVLAFLLMGGLLLGAAVLSGGKIGGGDIKLMALAGLSLGVWDSCLALIIALVLAAIVGSILLAMGRIQRDTPIPFGVFLGIGIFMAHLYGEKLVAVL